MVGKVYMNLGPAQVRYLSQIPFSRISSPFLPCDVCIEERLTNMFCLAFLLSCCVASASAISGDLKSINYRSLSEAELSRLPKPQLSTSNVSSIDIPVKMTLPSLDAVLLSHDPAAPSFSWNDTFLDCPTKHRIFALPRNNGEGGGGGDGPPGGGHTGGEGECSWNSEIDCCPDPRAILTNNSGPWGQTGRIVSPNIAPGKEGICSGTLVGPRHVLTAGHCVNWDVDGNGDVGAMIFQPQFRSSPVQPDRSVVTIHYPGNSEKGNPTSEEGLGLDFVVAILDAEPGLGWMGSKTYNTDWNNEGVWAVVGYAGDFGNGDVASYQNDFPIVDAWHPGFFGQEDGLNIRVGACVRHGYSGGGVFSTFTDGWPYVVGVAVFTGDLPVVIGDWTGDRVGHWAAGGADMVNLINEARSIWP